MKLKIFLINDIELFFMLIKNNYKNSDKSSNFLNLFFFFYFNPFSKYKNIHHVVSSQNYKYIKQNYFFHYFLFFIFV